MLRQYNIRPIQDDSCIWDPELKTTVHKFKAAQRTCECQEVTVKEKEVYNMFNRSSQKPDDSEKTQNN